MKKIALLLAVLTVSLFCLCSCRGNGEVTDTSDAITLPQTNVTDGPLTGDEPHDTENEATDAETDGEATGERPDDVSHDEQSSEPDA